MTEQDKAREAARLLMAWADGKTLQMLLGPGKWDDYTSRRVPDIHALSCWRVKPEPRRKWEIGGDCYSTTWSADEAANWKSRGYTVTEWQEVVS